MVQGVGYIAKQDVIEYTNELNKDLGEKGFSKVEIKPSLSKTISSSLNNRALTISVYGKALTSSDRNMGDAIKILVGREIAKYLLPSLNIRKTNVLKKDGDTKHKTALLKCCFESAYDIWGYKRFISDNQLTCNSKTLENFRLLINGTNEEEKETHKVSNAKKGKLQTNLRIGIMNRRANGKNVVEDILDFYGNAMRIGEIEFNTSYYRMWLKYILAREHIEIYKILSGK